MVRVENRWNFVEITGKTSEPFAYKKLLVEALEWPSHLPDSDPELYQRVISTIWCDHEFLKDHDNVPTIETLLLHVLKDAAFLRDAAKKLTAEVERLQEVYEKISEAIEGFSAEPSEEILTFLDLFQ